MEMHFTLSFRYYFVQFNLRGSGGWRRSETSFGFLTHKVAWIFSWPGGKKWKFDRSYDQVPAGWVSGEWYASFYDPERPKELCYFGPQAFIPAEVQ